MMLYEPTGGKPKTVSQKEQIMAAIKNHVKTGGYGLSDIQAHDPSLIFDEQSRLKRWDKKSAPVQEQTEDCCGKTTVSKFEQDR